MTDSSSPDTTRRLVVIIPALNEEATIGTVIACIREVAMPAGVGTLSIVVANDGSTDATREIAEKAGAHVVSHEVNRGVGAAFRTGLHAALSLGADFIVNIDADGQFNPNDIPMLLEPLLGGRADFATASRFKDPDLVPEMPAVKLWGNRQMSRLISCLVGKRFYDVSCGFRAYTRDTALRLNLWGDFTYTQETFLDLSAKDLRIAEIPARVRGVREVGESRVARSLVRYARQTSEIIFHAYRDFWPLRFFGAIAVVGAAPGLCLVSFLGLHYLRTGRFSPHLWSGFLGGAFIFFALICLVTGLLASMLKRIRLNQEELLFLIRRGNLGSRDSAGDDT